MATTTRSRLRALLATATGFYYSGTNTATATASVTDTGIQRWDTGRLIDRWVLMTAGNNDGKSRRISAVSSSVATVGTAFGGGNNVNTDTFEILPFDPDIMHYALEEAMRTVWPKPARLGRAAKGLYARRTDKTLVVDNLLTGWDFEDWTSTTSNGAVATGWTDVGTPDTNRESSRIVHGSYAMKITTNANPEGIEQNIFTSSLASAVNTDQLVGKTLHVQGWVWASAASAARIRVTYDGSTYDNGPYHGGTSEWEGPDTQSLDSVIESGMTEIMISLEVISGNTAYFDGVVAWIDSVAEYTVPTTLYPGGVHRVLQQTDESEPRGVYAPLMVGSSRAGRILRLEGIGRLSVPTTDAGTTEVDEIEGELIVAEAAMHMYRVLANTERENRAEYLQEADTWSRNAAELRESVGSGFIGADPQIGWRISPEEARTLYVER